MNINALTVCVNYADELELGIKRWRDGLNNWCIITSTTDTQTAELAEKHDCIVFKTDVFYENGAAFNKGAALEQARQAMAFKDWVLLLDADVVPPVHWKRIVMAAPAEAGWLHGAIRHECSDVANLDPGAWPRPKHDRGAVGFFQLYHSADRVAQDVPLIDTHWKHAGNYDSTLIRRWRAVQRIKMLDLHLCHIGERDNWFGKGNKEAFMEMQRERERRGGWDHETVESPI